MAVCRDVNTSAGLTYTCAAVPILAPVPIVWDVIRAGASFALGGAVCRGAPSASTRAA